MPHAAVTRLLQCLNNFHPQLPRSYHTLFPPPALQYEPMNDGLYVHIPNWIPSLQDMLSCFGVTVSSDTSTYCLVVNIDGRPLFSSSPNYKLHISNIDHCTQNKGASLMRWHLLHPNFFKLRNAFDLCVFEKYFIRSK